MRSRISLLIRCTAAFFVTLSLLTHSALALQLAPGAGKREVSCDGKTIPVWYYIPDKAKSDTPVLIVMHGVNRDADRYRDEWIPHAQRYGFILIAPEFSKEAFPGEERYNLGNVFDEQQRLRPPAEWTFRFLEPIFEAMKASTGNQSKRFHLYGHSAGAQFVHRYLFFMPDAPVAKAVAANAGWWTQPEPKIDFPYGLRGSTIDENALKKILQRPLIVLLGTEDIDPNHAHLRRTSEAMAQGPHRFARGHSFFAAGSRQANELGFSLGWQLATAPGVGHSDKGMAEFAVRYLFGQPAIQSRDADRVRILFGGDTSSGESYQEQYAKQGETNVLAEKGYQHGIAKLECLLREADFRVINLETPLTVRRESPLKTKDYLHYSDPVKLPALFAPFGPVAYSLANNHSLDFGPEGLDETRAAIIAAGAESFGAGPNRIDAERPLLQEFRLSEQSITLAVFGAFEFRQDYDRDFHFYASDEKPGTAAIDVASVRNSIVALRRQNPTLFIVYFVHWGGNYEWKSSSQIESARLLRDAGVDLVIGHGAHMLQEVEHDGRGWIFYSIGNFLFNARGRYATHKAPPFSLPLMVDLTIRDDRIQTTIRGYPIVSDNQLTGYQPRVVTETELPAVHSLLAEKSGWNDNLRHAVKKGVDNCGPFLEFADK